MEEPSRKRAAFAACAGLLAALLLSAGFAQAAEKEPRKPYPRYWMSAATQNFSMPGMPEGMSAPGGMFGNRMGGPGRSLLLQLNSPQSLPPDPSATHDIPPGQRMGDTLPLIIPARPKAERTEEGPERHDRFEKPRARLLMYWGCGEKVKAGQPRVLDTDKMGPLEFGKAMAGHAPSPQYPPSPRSGWIYSEWPNEKKHIEVPKDASLKGDHYVHGNYIPDIRFSIDERHDFLAPVEFTSIKGGGPGGISVQWRAIPAAVGYFATAMAHNEKSGETIIWTSSEVPEPGYGLMDYLPSADVRRFVKEKVVMAPGTVSCAIPGGIFKDSEGAMLQFIAYGEDLHLAYPPRPKDPKKTWEPVWAVRVRLKSTGMTPLAGSEQEEVRQPRENAQKRERSQRVEETEERKPDKDGSGSPLNVIKGLFGF